MKLYTEKQVKDMLNRVMMLEHHIVEFLNKYYTPIQLPSDEEIEERAERNVNKYSFIDGVEWLKDKIQGSSK